MLLLLFFSGKIDEISDLIAKHKEQPEAAIIKSQEFQKDLSSKFLPVINFMEQQTSKVNSEDAKNQKMILDSMRALLDIFLEAKVSLLKNYSEENKSFYKEKMASTTNEVLVHAKATTAKKAEHI